MNLIQRQDTARQELLAKHSTDSFTANNRFTVIQIRQDYGAFAPRGTGDIICNSCGARWERDLRNEYQSGAPCPLCFGKPEKKRPAALSPFKIGVTLRGWKLIAEGAA